jgi:hypothetical protein
MQQDESSVATSEDGDESSTTVSDPEGSDQIQENEMPFEDESDKEDASAYIPHLENSVKAPPSETPGVYVSEELAKDRVFRYAGVEEKDVSGLKISLNENEGDGKYYLVEFSAHNQQYKYKVQAVSAVVSPIS